jgi:hypothetical protein
MKPLYKLSLILVLFFSACHKNEVEPTVNKQANAINKVVTTLVEGFESGTKTAYAAADVTLSSGVWNLNDALIGNSTSDRKVGTQSARIRNSGKLTMKFDKTTGAGIVTIQHAKYGTDANGTWQLWYSTNGGTSFTQSGATVTTSSTALSTASFTINIAGNVRIEIRKTDAGTNRINFDEITINDYTGNPNPIPTLTTIGPATCAAGAASFTLTVNGSNFINGSIIKWNTTNLTTTFVSATQLSASVSASLVATAGSANVTVFNPTPGGGTSSATTFTISAVQSTVKKFLFDAKHAQTAGNADWVIDQDNNTPQRIPTPLQSNITSSTAETYWTGAISAWGIALAKLGHKVETLPSTGAITYGNTTNAQDLSNYHVFVIDEPNTIFTAAEKVAILQFVQNGGGLCMIANHNISDRNNDGWDAPAIWNDFFTNNTIQSNPFGFSVDYNNISVTSSNVFTGSHPVMNGTSGTVTQVQFNSGATITLNTTANPNAQGLVWRSGYTQNNTNIMSAVSTFGNGRAFIIGDSSPMDDGTGAPGNTLYNGWSVYSHTKLMMNASLWLAKLQ